MEYKSPPPTTSLGRFNKQNLNNEIIPGADEPMRLPDFSTSEKGSKFEVIEVYFRDIEQALLKKIKEYENGIIFGSVAWLTSIAVLNALAKCNSVQILIQKEDFLRPDYGTTKSDFWKRYLRGKYDNLQFLYERHQLKPPIGLLSVCNDPVVQSVRCVGNHNEDNEYVMPRAHNKFLVFCSIKDNKSIKVNYVPEAVWTGSFNLTTNATLSLENVVFMQDKKGKNKVIQAYLKEHHHLYGISEPLDWKHNWVEPEYRLET